MTDRVCAELPVLELAIEPKDKADRARLADAVSALTAGDPALSSSGDDGTGQFILKGNGERHLDEALSALIRDSGVALHIGAPQVAYRETVSHPAEVDHTHKRFVAGAREFARVKLHVRPADIDGRVRFSSRIAEGDLPGDFVLAVASGVASVTAAGVVAGFPVVNVEIELRDAASHASASSERAFESAARTACREALVRAGAGLLEPIMSVEVSAPTDRLEAVSADLVSRRSQIERRGPAEGDAAVVVALTPLANLFGYENTLRSITRGRGSVSTRFERYDRVPPPGDDDPPSAPAVALRR